MIILNSLICLLIVIRIVLFERQASQHRPLISFTAYIIAVAAGIETLQGVMGSASTPSISSLTLNALLCTALYSLKGNVAELFKDSSSKQCRIAKLLRWQPKQKVNS